tara:strand:- start:103 stop:237 length:135 start_codon:yes stop_codon:yes gene_type:complete
MFDKQAEKQQNSQQKQSSQVIDLTMAGPKEVKEKKPEHTDYTFF